MPTIGTLGDIKFSVYKENTGKHKKLHVHAFTGGDEVSLDLDGNVVVGNISNKKKLSYAKDWVKGNKNYILSEINRLFPE
jgi:hypothetical protein